MPIEVQCPKGHRLTCSEDRAGTQGKCPKCGTTFQVPDRNGKPSAPASAGQISSGSGKGPSSSDTIVFLCPNGHKLNGPSSLQGQPGQCPHCGAKFRIPIYDDEDAIEEVDDLETVDDDLELEVDDDPGASSESFAAGFSDAGHVHDPYPVPPPPSAGDSFLPGLNDNDNDDIHPAARLFMMLWAEKEHGGLVELHLADGVTIVPDWWSERYSHGTHTLFAIQTADGKYVMECVPWESIKRVIVRQISELPGGVFD